jgi:hypothetical protein
MRERPHLELERELQRLTKELELEHQGRTHNHHERKRLSEELERERLARSGISGTSNALSETFGNCSRHSRLRRRAYGQTY